jgi:hypothetical protein
MPRLLKALASLISVAWPQADLRLFTGFTSPPCPRTPCGVL